MGRAQSQRKATGPERIGGSSEDSRVGSGGGRGAGFSMEFEQEVEADQRGQKNRDTREHVQKRVVNRGQQRDEPAVRLRDGHDSQRVDGNRNGQSRTKRRRDRERRGFSTPCELSSDQGGNDEKITRGAARRGDDDRDAVERKHPARLDPQHRCSGEQGGERGGAADKKFQLEPWK